MSFKEWVCDLFGMSDIDLMDISEEEYYELEDIYNEVFKSER